jgi:hypothetical protein
MIISDTLEITTIKQNNPQHTPHMKKYSLLFLIIGIGALIFFTQKIVLPLVYDVVKSDAFLIDSKDQGSQLPIANSMTEIAFLHCNNYIKAELGENSSLNFSDRPLNSWSLGNYEYVISGETTITNDAKAETKKYACRIAYQNGDNLEGAADMDNWSVEGIDGIEGL